MRLSSIHFKYLPHLIFQLFFILDGTTYSLNQQLHLAPMANYTTRHLRYLYRMLTSYSQHDTNENGKIDVVLWSEMIKPKDILATKTPHTLLSRGKEEESDKHCVLQFGGDKAEELTKSIHIAKEYGYTQYNLNCGCPAATNEAPYGAQLMKRPEHVAYLVEKMAEASQYEIPISVKCRIGIHETCDNLSEDYYENLYDFVDTITKSGTVKNIVVHARSAVLRGLSPAKNRYVPDLKHEFVHQLAKDMPNVSIILNGGITKLRDCMDPAGDDTSRRCSTKRRRTKGIINSNSDIGKIDGIMLGRSALRNPFEFGAFLDDNKSILSLQHSLNCIDKYMEYIETEMMYCDKGSDISDLILPLVLLAYSIEQDLDGHDQNENENVDSNDNYNNDSRCMELIARSNCLGWHIISQTSRLFLSAEEQPSSRFEYWVQKTASTSGTRSSSTAAALLSDFQSSDTSQCTSKNRNDYHNDLVIDEGSSPPLKKWRKEIGTHFCGKKVIQKMKSNLMK